MKQLIGLGLFIIIWTFVSSDLPAHAQEPNYLHSEGSRIVDSHGNQVIMTGINWFGLETEIYAPHGLWARSLESMLDQIQDLGFNTLRLPYSNELFDPSSTPNGINYDLNPDLEGLNGLEIMDKIIEGAGERGIRVILDRHRPDSNAQSELWYTPEYSEERWINDWVMLAERYSGNPTVIGMDLHNEPHGQATWGTSDPATDWRLAAERAGNAILAVNPHLLIIVEGVERYQDDWYWWGGNLMGAEEYPVRLDRPDQLVYSTHVYGPGVYPQPWFSEPEFPDNLMEIWDQHWAYLSRENTAPIIVGEFGGRSVGQDLEGIWQRSLVSYLRENNISYFYWTLNPNSGDTGGLLLDDWQTVDSEKLALLSDHQFPSLGAEVPTIEPIAQIPTVGPINPEALRVEYRTANAAQQSQDSKPEFIITNSGSTQVPLASIELYYWLDDESNQPLGFHCDWAAVGCSNVLGEFNTRDDGEQFLRLFFSPAAGVLLQQEDSGEIKIRFNRSDWTPFQQNDDFSFAPQTEYTEWPKVSLYVNGERVWGEEPGTDDSGAPGSPVEPATPVPELPTTRPSTAATSSAVEQTQVTTAPPNLTEEGLAEEVAAANPVEGFNVSPTPIDQLGSTSDSGSIQPVLISLLIGAAVLMLGVGILVGMLLSRGNS